MAKKQKDPAFLFYPDNFMTGTMFLSDEQVGKYIRLLCAQHLTGHLSEKDMLKICKTYDEDIFTKFEKDEAGRYFNPRLEEEVGKRLKYSESRRNNRKKKEDMSMICKTYDKHMGNGNGNINSINNNINLREKFFEDLAGSSGFEAISIDLSIPSDKLAEMIPDFRKYAKPQYPNFQEFTMHFKNWAAKRIAASATRSNVRELK